MVDDHADSFTVFRHGYILALCKGGNAANRKKATAFCVCVAAVKQNPRATSKTEGMGLNTLIQEAVESLGEIKPEDT